MADGLNNPRAFRITELVGDLRSILTYIARCESEPAAEDYNLQGYVLLRRCKADAQVLLNNPFRPGNETDNEEQQKLNLRRVITDAAARRFQAQRIYLRVTTALRWQNNRAAVLQGGRPHAGHTSMLNRLDTNLATELRAISDQRVYASCQELDRRDERWTAEDPTLETILRIANA